MSHFKADWLVYHILPNGDRNKPFYGIATLGTENGVQYNFKEAERTIGKVMEFDANDNVFVLMAYDNSLLVILEFFPPSANNFKRKGWKEKSRLLFLRDFVGALEDWYRDFYSIDTSVVC